MFDRNGEITLPALDCVAFFSSSAKSRSHLRNGEIPSAEVGGRGRKRGREKELLLKKVPMSFGTSPFGGSRLGGSSISTFYSPRGFGESAAVLEKYNAKLD